MTLQVDPDDPYGNPRNRRMTAAARSRAPAPPSTSGWAGPERPSAGVCVNCGTRNSAGQAPFSPEQLEPIETVSRPAPAVKNVAPGWVLSAPALEGNGPPLKAAS
ncbi:hypothetical protein CIHG_00497 [Coccidioides immitis H538.4]|uniref:Uncharacterized protein n=1 Tax=Coccidioides immitis H538.4 TaxID=396776 RepID=A0A0J8RDU2_COCIT|nr:hypothetical protein CIHG_00497 [Coccidioides immitis H538.4]